MKFILLLSFLVTGPAFALETEDSIFAMLKDPVECKSQSGKTQLKLDINARQTAQRLMAEGFSGADYKRAFILTCSLPEAFNVLKAAKAGEMELTTYFKVAETPCQIPESEIRNPMEVAKQLKRENIPADLFLSGYAVGCNVEIGIAKAKSSPARKIDMNLPGGGAQ